MMIIAAFVCCTAIAARPVSPEEMPNVQVTDLCHFVAVYGFMDNDLFNQAV